MTVGYSTIQTELEVLTIRQDKGGKLKKKGQKLCFQAILLNAEKIKRHS